MNNDIFTVSVLWHLTFALTSIFMVKKSAPLALHNCVRIFHIDVFFLPVGPDTSLTNLLHDTGLMNSVTMTPLGPEFAALGENLGAVFQHELESTRARITSLEVSAV